MKYLCFAVCLFVGTFTFADIPAEVTAWSPTISDSTADSIVNRVLDGMKSTIQKVEQHDQEIGNIRTELDTVKGHVSTLLTMQEQLNITAKSVDDLPKTLAGIVSEQLKGSVSKSVTSSAPSTPLATSVKVVKNVYPTKSAEASTGPVGSGKLIWRTSKGDQSLATYNGQIIDLETSNVIDMKSMGQALWLYENGYTRPATEYQNRGNNVETTSVPVSVKSCPAGSKSCPYGQDVVYGS